MILYEEMITGSEAISHHYTVVCNRRNQFKAGCVPGYYLGYLEIERQTTKKKSTLRDHAWKGTSNSRQLWDFLRSAVNTAT